MFEMDEQFENFMQFCEGYLDESNKKLLTLAKKRYHECEEDYKCSQELFDFIHCTQTKILREESRFYVHLRDFLSILKENKAKDDGFETKLESGLYSNKRVHESSESENDVAFSAKRRKIEKYNGDHDKYEIEEHEEESSNQNFEDTGFSPPCDKLSNSSSIQKEEREFQDDSDKEMERSPENFEPYEEEEENEIWESVIVTGGDRSEHEGLVKNDSEFEELEDDDDNRNEEDDSDKESDSDQIDSCENDINERVKVSEVPEFSESESEGCSNQSRSELLKSEIRGKNGIFPSLGDNLGVNDINNIAKGKNKETVLRSKAAGNTEVTEILNISSETEEKGGGDDLLKNAMISTENCTELGNDSNQEFRKEKWNAKGVCVFESEGKPLCITIKCAKSAKADENVKRNPHLNHSSGRTEMNKVEKTDKRISSNEKAASECDSEDDGDDDDDGDNRKPMKEVAHLSEELESDVEGTGGDEYYEKISHTSKNTFEKYSGLSTDDDGEDDEHESALRAKKFRAKCKKKYVISVGKKKNKAFTTSSSSKEQLKLDFVQKFGKEKNSRKKPTPQNSPKCKKKPSPNKSPIIIFTDSESDDDVDMEGFKKKFDQKVKKQNQFQNNSTGKHGQSLIKKGQKMEWSNDSGSGEDMCHSGIENKKDSDKEHITTCVQKDKNDKKRVSLITEEFYSSKSDSELKHNRDRNSESKDKVGEEEKTLKKEEKCDEGHNKSHEKSLEQHENEREEVTPGPSISSDVDNVQKKGSSRQIRKLEALLESIRNKIEKVRMRELDLDDLDSDVSDYLLEDKLQRKFMKVWDKLCELHKAVRSTGRPTDKYFRYQGTRYPDINRKLEKFINKKKVFPDYHDVRGIIMKVNREKKLHLKSREIDDLSREAFTDIGNQLQKRRKKDFTSTFLPHGAHSDSLSLLDDPALFDLELKKKLDANRKSAKSNMEKVVEKYACLQYQEGDKTEEESEEEEEEEPANIDEDLDQLSGVDNSDSDRDHADDNAGNGDKSGDTSWESGPCLEIVTQQNIKNKNLESGQKSAFSADNPIDVQKLTPVKSALKRDASNKDNKERHFCEQLGLFRTAAEEEGIKDVEQSSSVESDDRSTEPKLPPPRMTFLPQNEFHTSPKDSNHFLRKDAESMKHSNSLHSDTNVQDDDTVMILSDIEDDEYLSLKETEKEKTNSTECKVSSNVSDQSQDMTDSDKNGNINFSETSSKVPTSPKVSTSPKIPENDTESTSDLENTEKAVVTTEVDVNNTSDVSNVTVITDDEDEDQSLGLKIVSSQHVSLSDINKLHGEEGTKDETGIVSNESDANECASLNSSSEICKESMKCSSEAEKEISVKNSPDLPFSKKKALNINELSNNIDNEITEKINEVLNSEPDVMIIDDIENEALPVYNSSWNTQVQKRNFVRKSDHSSDNIGRNHSNFSKVNRPKTHSAQGPVGSHCNTDFPVKSKGITNPSLSIRNTSKLSNTPALRQQCPSNVGSMNTVPVRDKSKVNSQRAANSSVVYPVSNTDWQFQSQKSPPNFNRDNTRPRTFQQFPRGINNTNKFIEGNRKVNTPTSSNIMRSTSNNSWRVQQNKFGKPNVEMSKAMAPMNMNSKIKLTSNSTLKTQQQKSVREANVSYSSGQYMQRSVQMSPAFKANPRSSIRMQSNTYQPYPNANKSWNAQSPKPYNSVQKINSLPQCSPRFTAVPSKACGSNVPTKTISSQFKQQSNKGFNIQGQNVQRANHNRNTCFANSQQKFTNNPNQVKKVSVGNVVVKQGSFSGPKVVEDIVIIDCDEVEQAPFKKNKSSKHKKCAMKVDTADDVICIDDPPHSEPPMEESDAVCIVSENVEQTVKDNENTNDINKTESKRISNSSNDPQSTKDFETSKVNSEQITKNSTSKILLEHNNHKSENTSMHCSKDENVELKNNANENDNKNKTQGNEKSAELKQDNKSKENTKSAKRTSSIEIERNNPDDDEVKSIPDIFEGSLGTVDSNECESLESYHDSETFDNGQHPDEVFDKFGKDENGEYDSEVSDEIFTAVKLDTVTVNSSIESTSLEAEKNKFSSSLQGPSVLCNKSFDSCQKTELENKEKSNTENITLLKNIEESVETRTDLVSNASSQDEDQQTSDDEEVSSGMQDEDSISSTSCDVDSHHKVKLGPDTRNKLLQLKKAVVKSKPETNNITQAKPQDTIPPHAQASDRAQWIEEDENASLIETYQEPDSMPYSLEDNQISSSSNENIIVLSDSE